MRIKPSSLKCLLDNWQTRIALLTTHNYPGEIKSRLVFVLIMCDFISDIFLIPPERLPDSGREVSCLFCQECGTRLFHNPARNSKITNVKPGTLDDTIWLKPVDNLWTRSSQKWVVLSEQMLNYEAQPSDFTQLFEQFQIE